MHRSTRSAGYTLVELMVAVMIIAVLLVIAVPSFQGFRRNAQDRVAQSSLVTAEKVAYLVVLQQGAIPDRATLLTLLPSLESSIEWIDHHESSSGPRQVSIDDDNGGLELALAALSDSGSCFYLRVVTGSQPARSAVPEAATCRAHDYQDGADTGW